MPRYKAPPLDVAITVEELAMDGEVCLGRISATTAYNDVKRVNDYLVANKYDWRVKLVIDHSSDMPYSLERGGRPGPAT